MMKKNADLKFSVVIPVVNMDKTIGESIASVLNQTYQNFEIIVQDNASWDNTAQVVKSFSDSRIKYFRNYTNIGYRNNLIAGWKNTNGDILYFLGADDVLSKKAFEETLAAFSLDENIGAVTRPYFWFHKDINIPVRVTPVLNKRCDEVVNINDYEKAIIALHNEVLGQGSGLAFRMKYLQDSFFTTGNEWIAHGYPFINIFKKHPIVFLRNYQVAVRIGQNTLRDEVNVNTFKLSPTTRWMDMLNEVFKDKEFQKIKKHFLNKVIFTNYIGLVQIRCYARFRYLIREICYLLKYKWTNILSPKFWFFSVGCIIMPKPILAKLVDYYKNKINSKIIEKINFEYDVRIIS